MTSKHENLTGRKERLSDHELHEVVGGGRKVAVGYGFGGGRFGGGFGGWRGRGGFGRRGFGRRGFGGGFLFF